MKRMFILMNLVLSLYSFAQADSIVRVGACKTAHHPKSLIVRDSMLYLADGGSFVVIDVSDPANPKIRDTTEDFPLAEADIVGINIFMKDSLAYIRCVECFVIINVANPDSLIMIGYILGLPTWGWADPRGLYVSDTIAFIANSNNGVIVCNIANPTNPTIIDTSFPTYCAINLTMRDSILFIADGDSVLIVNAKDPMNLQRISSVPTLEHVSGGALYDVAVQGNYAYFTVSWYYYPGRVGIVDISDLKNPEIIGEVRGLKGGPVAIDLENEYAYIATKNQYDPFVKGGIRVVDIENPDSASRTVSYDTLRNPQDVYVVGDLIYVADYDSVQILRHIHTGVEEKELRVESLELRVWPSPFEKQANIGFTITSHINGKIEIYDKIGRKVRTLYDSMLFPGRYRFYWNGRDKFGKEVANGEYFITLIAGNGLKETKKVIYLK